MFTYTGHRNLQASISRLNYYCIVYICTLYSWYLKQTHIVKISGDKLNLDTFMALVFSEQHVFWIWHYLSHHTWCGNPYNFWCRIWCTYSHINKHCPSYWFPLDRWPIFCSVLQSLQLAHTNNSQHICAAIQYYLTLQRHCSGWRSFQFIVPFYAVTIVQCIEDGIEGLTSSVTKHNTNVIHNSTSMFYSTLGTAPAQRSYFLAHCNLTYL